MKKNISVLAGTLSLLLAFSTFFSFTFSDLSIDSISSSIKENNKLSSEVSYDASGDSCVYFTESDLVNFETTDQEIIVDDLYFNSDLISDAAGSSNAVSVNSNYIYNWNPSMYLRDSIKDLGGEVLPSDAMLDYENNYYGTKGNLKTLYKENEGSFIYGNSDYAGQLWKTLLEIYPGSSYKGFRVSSATPNAVGVIFRAPVSGKYHFYPQSLNSDLSAYSVYSKSGDWAISVYTDSEVLISGSVDQGTGLVLPDAVVELEKGEALHIGFTAPGYINNGYQLMFNFGLGLLDENLSEIKIKDPEYEKVEYNPSTNLISVKPNDFTKDYDISPFGVVSGIGNDTSLWEKALLKKQNGEHIFVSDTSNNFSDNSLIFNGNDVKVQLRNDSDLYAISFTALFDGEYSFLADSITGNAKVVIMKGSETLSESFTDTLEHNVSLLKGETVCFVFNGSEDGSTASNLIISNFKVKSVEKVSDAVYGPGYVYKKTLKDTVDGVAIEYFTDDCLVIDFDVFNSAYSYEVFAEIDGVLVPLEETENNRFVLLNSLGDFVNICIRGYENRVKTVERYLTYVFSSGKSYEFFVSGKSVYKQAFSELLNNGVSFSALGDDVCVSIDNGNKIELDTSARINLASSGKYTATFYFENYSKKIDLTAFTPDTSTFAEFDVGYIEIEDDKILFESNGSSGDYSYFVKDFGGNVINSMLETEDTYCRIPLTTYGIYNAQIGFKNPGNVNFTSMFNKQINYNRPGGEWQISTEFDGSSLSEVVVTAGMPFDISVSALFGGETLSGTEYALFCKDWAGITPLYDFSPISEFSYIPEGSGVYNFIVAVKADGADSAEAFKEVTVKVNETVYDGDVNITGYDFNGIGKYARVEVSADDSPFGETYFRFYAVYNDCEVLIKDYSIDKFVEFIPTRKEHFDVKVEVKGASCEGAYDKVVTYHYDHTCTESEPYPVYASGCMGFGKEFICCTICGKILTVNEFNTGSHEFGEWQIVKEPTVSEKGLMKRFCLNDPSHYVSQEIDTLVVKDVTILTLPVKLIYTKGESFEPKGLSIQVTYTTTDKVDVFDKFDLSWFSYNFIKDGQQDVVLNFYGAEATFTVNYKHNILLGDVNVDGVLDYRDSDLITSYLLGKEDFIPNSADINFDGIIDLKDALLIRQFLSGYDVKYFLY